MKQKKIKICIFAPIPPPFIGPSYAVQIFLKLKFVNNYEISHIDTRYTNLVSTLGKPQTKKIFLLIKYLFKLIKHCHINNIKYVIITPAFTPLPFIKDSVVILVAHYLTKAKIILWSHSNNVMKLYNNSNFLFRWYISFVLKKAFHAITVAEKLKYNFFHFLTKKNITAIHNTIPCIIKSNYKKKFSNIVHVLYLGQMIKSKGWLLLLKAAQNVCLMRKNAVFWFCGPQSADSTLEEIRRKFSMTEFKSRIQYKGPIFGEEKMKFFMESDIFCLPTLYEAFPITILEAMQIGLPIISTNVGGITEAIIDKKGGIIVEKKNIKQLIEAIIYLIDHPEERIKMGIYNRKRFKENFTMNKISEKWNLLIMKLEGHNLGHPIE